MPTRHRSEIAGDRAGKRAANRTQDREDLEALGIKD